VAVVDLETGALLHAVPVGTVPSPAWYNLQTNQAPLRRL
jgi:hypothetical protein